MADKDRYYWPDTLELVTEVPKANGEMTANFDVRHARKYGLLPSITRTIKDVLGAGVPLVNYHKEQIAMWTVANPKRDDESDEDYIARAIAGAAEHGHKAADEGTAIHADVQRWVEHKQEPVTHVGYKAVDDLQAFLDFVGFKTLTSEQPLGCGEKGVAGTPDLLVIGANLRKAATWEGWANNKGEWEHEKLPEEGDIIVDIKTREFMTASGKPKYRHPYDETLYQLGGYAYLSDVGIDSMCVVWAIDRTGLGSKWFMFPNLMDWRDAYVRLLENWFFTRKHDPRRKEDV
jgi:hypothetical protein